MADKRIETLEAEITTLHQTLQVRSRMRKRAAAPSQSTSGLCARAFTLRSVFLRSWEGLLMRGAHAH